jgi:hypothetical protein
VVASRLAISSSSFWPRTLRRSCLPKPNLLRWTMRIPAAMAAEWPVLDEPKAIGPRAFRASEQRPRPAVPEPDVRQADQLPTVANLDDRVRRVELHHAHRAQVWDFHALELIEKPAPICVCSTFGHGAEATTPVPSAKRAPFSAQPRGPLVKGLRVHAHAQDVVGEVHSDLVAVGLDLLRRIEPPVVRDHVGQVAHGGLDNQFSFAGQLLAENFHPRGFSRIGKPCGQFFDLAAGDADGLSYVALTVAMVVVPPKTERASSPSLPTPRAASCKSLLTPVSDPPQLHSCRGRCHGVGGLVAEEHDENQLTSAQSHRVLRDAAMTTWREAVAAAALPRPRFLALFTCQTRPASLGSDEQNQ